MFFGRSQNRRGTGNFGGRHQYSKQRDDYYEQDYNNQSGGHGFGRRQQHYHRDNHYYQEEQHHHQEEQYHNNEHYGQQQQRYGQYDRGTNDEYQNFSAGRSMKRANNGEEMSQQRQTRFSRAEGDQGQEGIVNRWTDDGRNASDLEQKELLAYFYRVQKIARNTTFETDQERVAFVENSLQEFVRVKEEVNEFEFFKLCNDVIGSRTVQTVSEMATERQLRFLFHHLMPQIFLASTGKYLSFIVQMILRAAVHIVKEEPQVDEENEEANLREGIPSMRALLHKMVKNLHLSWLKLVTNKNGTHIVRALLSTLKSEGVQEDQLFEKIVQVLLKVMHMDRWIVDKVASPVLGLLVELTPNTSTLHTTLCHRILNISNDSGLMDESVKKRVRHEQLVNHEVASHVIETIVKNTNKSLFDSLYSFVFRNQLKLMSTAKYANFIVSSLVEHATHKEQFELMFDELLGAAKDEDSMLDKIWKGKTRGVICAIGEQCTKYATRQKELMKHLLQLTGANVTDSSVRRQFLQQIMGQPLQNQGRNEYDRFGCRLLIALSKFAAQHIQVLIESITALPLEQIIDMSTEKNGSLAMEALVQCSGLNPRTRWLLVKRLTGKFTELAVNVYGSRVVEKMFSALEVKNKQKIAEELVAHEEQVKASPHGLIIWIKCYMDQYKKSQDEWMQKAEQKHKRESMFKDLLSDQHQQQQQQQQPEESKPLKKQSGGKKQKKERAAPAAHLVVSEEEKLDTHDEEEEKLETRDEKEKLDAHDEEEEAAATAPASSARAKKKKETGKRKGEQKLEAQAQLMEKLPAMSLFQHIFSSKDSGTKDTTSLSSAKKKRKREHNEVEKDDLQEEEASVEAAAASVAKIVAHVADMKGEEQQTRQKKKHKKKK